MSQKKRKKGEDPSSVWLHRNSTYHFFSAGAQVTALHHPKNVPLADNSLGAGHGCWALGYGCRHWVQIHPFGFIRVGTDQGPPLDSLPNPLPLWRKGNIGATISWGNISTIPFLAATFPCGWRRWIWLVLAGQRRRCYLYFRTELHVRQTLKSPSL